MSMIADKHFESWDMMIDQCRRDDVISPGEQEGLKRKFRSYQAALLRDVAKEMRGWTRRCDDAKRIPDVLYEMADRIDGGSRGNS